MKDSYHHQPMIVIYDAGYCATILFLTYFFLIKKKWKGSRGKQDKLKATSGSPLTFHEQGRAIVKQTCILETPKHQKQCECHFLNVCFHLLSNHLQRIVSVNLKVPQWHYTWDNVLNVPLWSLMNYGLQILKCLFTASQQHSCAFRWL